MMDKAEVVGMGDMTDMVDNINIVDNMNMNMNMDKNMSCNSTKVSWLIEVAGRHFRINNVDLVMVDTVDNMAMVTMVESNDKVYLLEKNGPSWD